MVKALAPIKLHSTPPIRHDRFLTVGVVVRSNSTHCNKNMSKFIGPRGKSNYLFS